MREETGAGIAGEDGGGILSIVAVRDLIRPMLTVLSQRGRYTMQSMFRQMPYISAFTGILTIAAIRQGV